MKYLIVFIISIFMFHSSLYPQCQECEEDLKDCQQRLRDLKSDVNSLKDQLKDCNKNQRPDNTSKLKELNEKNNKLNKQVDSLNNMLMECIDLNSNNITKLTTCQEQLRITQIEKDSLRKNIVQLQDSINYLTNKLIECEKLPPNVRLKKEIEKLKLDIENKESELDSTSQILENVKDEYGAITSEIKSKNIKLMSIQDVIKKLEIEKDNLSTKIKQLKDDVDSKDDNLQDVIHKINSANNELSGLKVDISNKENYIRSLNNDISRTENKLSDLEAKLPGHFTIALALSANWNYGSLEEKYTTFTINSWNWRTYFGYNLDVSIDNWDERSRTTVIGIIINNGVNSKENIKTILQEQKIDTIGISKKYYNQFYEYEFGIIVSEIFQVSAGYGNQEYEVINNTKKSIKNLNYLTLSFGLQVPINEFFDVGLSSSFQYGMNYYKVSSRFGLYVTGKLNFLKW